MDDEFVSSPRRLVLAGGSRLALAGVALIGLGRPLMAIAAKADKKDFAYQDKPKDGKSCSTCRMYLPGEGGKSICAIVDGEISPMGWCLAYSPRG